MVLPHMAALHPAATGHWVTPWPRWLWFLLGTWRVVREHGLHCAGGLKSMQGVSIQAEDVTAYLQRTSYELF